ncbi:MAG: hypothetical protein LBG79_04815 [Spirochaetaceae bacterium]|jgi:hypothetical protein|nr:hypothetical protein [Spirochaetaceae bacterium]
MPLQRIVFLFFLFTSLKAGADVPIEQIADDSSIRRHLAKTYFIDPPLDVLARKPVFERLDSGDITQIRSERSNNGEFSIIIARQSGGAFPGWGQGSFILTRNIAGGQPVRARIFLRSDPYTYIQFRPSGASKSEMDAVVYDALLTQSLPVALPFEKLIETPLLQLLDILDKKFPRRYYNPNSEDYGVIRKLLGEVRNEIRPLKFGDDGAINENGVYVYIKDLSPQKETSFLNCSGFAKWFVDGILRPVTGARLAVAPLKMPFGKRGTNFTEPFERIRDPFFGLDWSRNLAAAAAATLKSPAFASLNEIEVRSAPFQAMLKRHGRTSAVCNYPGHLENIGFSFEGIQPLLYTLAIDEPGNVFIAAISRVGGTPPLRTYFHVAVLAPYFDESNMFHVAVFESAEETSFSRFRVRYPQHHVSLCRIPVESAFSP